jgi:ubiquinone biosynthesis protein
MKNGVICPIDFGMMGVLDQERIDDLLGFLVSVLTSNAERMIRQFQKQGIIDEYVDARSMRSDIADLMDRYLGVEVSKIDVAVYIQQLFDVITRYRVILPADLLLMGKSLATIDGIARDIYPELDPLQSIKPHILQIYFQRLTDPEFYTRDAKRAAEDAVLFLQRLPRDLRIITSKLRDGELKVKLEPDGAGLDKWLKEHDRATNRLSIAILIIGFLAVGCYLVANAYSPTFYDAGTQQLSSIGRTMLVFGFAAGAIGSLSGLGYLYGYLRSGGP